MNKFKEPFDMASIPDSRLFEEAKTRHATRREQLGSYYRMKKFRPCKGCGKVLSAREMRTHPCSIAWTRR